MYSTLIYNFFILTGFDDYSYACPTATVVNVNRSSPNYEDDHSNKTSICSTGDYRNNIQKTDTSMNKQIYRGSSFVPIPPAPPPFLKPTLKPVNRNLNAKRPCSSANLDPRDLLLSSIKNFDRDSLRKLRLK